MKAIYYVVGTKYRGEEAMRLLHSLQTGEQVELRPDPGNPKDRNAVEVWARGQWVGFLPAPQAARLAPRLNAMALCTYPRCKCVVQISSTKPEPDCPQALVRFVGTYAVTADRRPSVEVEE